MKRLKSRVDALERGRQAELSPAAVDMLAAVYGRCHAWFMPARKSPETWPVIRRFRIDYHTGRRGIAARATGAKDWVAGHDCRRELVSAGLAVDVRGDAETTGLILTTAGRSVAWSMVADVIPAVPLAEFFVESLRTAEPDRVRDGEHWVSESAVFGRDCVGDCSQWQDWTDALLEPCVSGAVDSLCDMSGRCYYRFVREFEPLPIAEGIEPSGRAIDAYVAAFVSEIDRRHRIDDASGEIVIPLSVTR
jgi:hypothetical protein